MGDLSSFCFLPELWSLKCKKWAIFQVLKLFSEDRHHLVEFHLEYLKDALHSFKKYGMVLRVTSYQLGDINSKVEVTS